jgi:parvulin-like peptidyl-prolyl isomerase
MSPGQLGVFADAPGAGSVFVIRLKEKVPSRVQPQSEVKDIVLDRIREEGSVMAAEAKAQEVNDTIKAEKITLEECAERFGLKMLTSEPIMRKGYLDEVGPAENILNKAFLLKPGETLDYEKTRKGFVICRLDQLDPVDLTEFEKNKEEYRTKFLEEKKKAVLEEWFIGIAQNTRLLVSLEAA